MPLTIYRRHSNDCRVHKLKLKASAKRFYTECDCPIWLTGATDAEPYPRQSTKTRDCIAAEAYPRSLVACSKDTATHGPTLADCIQRFLDAHAEEIGAKALRQYRLTLARLQKFAHSRNKFFMSELTVNLLEDFKVYG